MLNDENPSQAGPQIVQDSHHYVGTLCHRRNVSVPDPLPALVQNGFHDHAPDHTLLCSTDFPFNLYMQRLWQA